MKVGYARVSSKDQNLDRQIKELKEAGAEKIFKEKKSGRNVQDREEFIKALEFMREGDIFITDSLERLGRNYDDIISNVRKLDRDNIALIVLNMPILNQDLGDPLLQKFVRNFIIQLLSWVAESERLESKRKQRQGIAIAKEKGVYKGRPVKYSPYAKNPQDRLTYNEIVKRLQQEQPIKKIAEDTGVTRDTVYRIKKELKHVEETN